MGDDDVDDDGSIDGSTIGGATDDALLHVRLLWLWSVVRSCAGTLSDSTTFAFLDQNHNTTPPTTTRQS